MGSNVDTEPVCSSFLCVKWEQSFARGAVSVEYVRTDNPTRMEESVFMAQYELVLVLFGFHEGTLMRISKLLE